MRGNLLIKMPNYVYGTLSVSGTKGEVQKFKEYAQSEEESFDDITMKTEKWTQKLDMNKFIPYPKKFKVIDDKVKKFYESYKKVKQKVEKGEKLTKKEQKQARELALLELEGKGSKPHYKGSDGFNSGGYEWCVQNWGTKWNFGDVEIQDKENALDYSFTTAWSVPMPILFKMSKMFPNLIFNYSGDEESEEFQVEYEFKEGKMKVIEEKNWSDIQIEKIQDGEDLDYFEDDVKEELEKHKGHKIIFEDDKFMCVNCAKTIWDTKAK